MAYLNRQPRENKLISIENTNFIFNTNFSGDPNRDRFGSTARRANVIIPTYDQAMELMEMGLNVKQTNPREGEEEGFEPEYFLAVNINYDSTFPPKIYLVSGDADPVELDANSVGMIDNCYVLNVNVVLNPYRNQVTGRSSAYVRTMYVEQDIADDPFASRYVRRRED
jgi:hypothetical protein